jgi:hypothetical protein
MSGWSPGASGDTFWDNMLAAGIAYETALPLYSRGALHATSTVTVGRQLPPVDLKAILDGTSNTLLVGEYHTLTNPNNGALARRGLWAYAYTSYNQSSAVNDSATLIPDYMRCLEIQTADHNCKRAFASLHAGNIIQFAYCDGSVNSISQDIDMAVYGDLATIASEGASLGAASRRP